MLPPIAKAMPRPTVVDELDNAAATIVTVYDTDSVTAPCISCLSRRFVSSHSAVKNLNHLVRFNSPEADSVSRGSNLRLDVPGLFCSAQRRDQRRDNKRAERAAFEWSVVYEVTITTALKCFKKSFEPSWFTMESKVVPYSPFARSSHVRVGQSGTRRGEVSTRRQAEESIKSARGCKPINQKKKEKKRLFLVYLRFLDTIQQSKAGQTTVWSDTTNGAASSVYRVSQSLSFSPPVVGEEK
ncbi:hypothetical protein F2P81_001239 [Scophthalmus maximus]|uniref:Uncharacterized protein n=1 Tax=Scophthalmus maximus TaxID=52904 RepID=A0A6A4TJ95_SCOMX|nr:hypothetical protein F2P81_001239 [Scophthalmus maximus]